MKKTFAIIAIFSLICAAGCEESETSETNNQENVEIENATISEETNTILEEDINILESIIADETAGSDDCAAINDEELKKTCEQGFIYKKAISEKNKDICAELENETDQETCAAEIEK